MLQILLENNGKSSLADSARQALKDGFEWLILPPDTTDDDIDTVAGICREAGVILTIEDNIEACRKHGLHGVFLRLGANPPAVRRELGAEAIIGAEIASAATATELAKADIDYFAMPPAASHVVGEIRSAGIQTPIVAIGTTAAELQPLLAAGFSGIMING